MYKLFRLRTCRTNIWFHSYKTWTLAVSFFSLSIFLAAQGLAADITHKSLNASRSLRCTFEKGSVAKWNEGQVVIEEDPSQFTLDIDNIDLQARKARGIGNNSTSDLAIIMNPGNWTFIETTGFGGFIATTVYDRTLPGQDNYYAVNSRHQDFPSRPLPSQFHGTCRILQYR